MSFKTSQWGLVANLDFYLEFAVKASMHLSLGKPISIKVATSAWLTSGCAGWGGGCTCSAASTAASAAAAASTDLRLEEALEAVALAKSFKEAAKVDAPTTGIGFPLDNDTNDEGPLLKIEDCLCCSLSAFSRCSAIIFSPVNQIKGKVNTT